MMKKYKDLVPWLIYFLVFGGMIFARGREHYLHLAMQIIILGLFAVSFNVLFGKTGLLSFGQALFYGLGAYITGMAAKNFGADYFFWALLAIPIVAIIVSVLLGA